MPGQCRVVARPLVAQEGMLRVELVPLVEDAGLFFDTSFSMLGAISSSPFWNRTEFLVVQIADGALFGLGRAVVN